MFSGASVFNQDLSGWDVSSGTNFVSIISTNKNITFMTQHIIFAHDEAFSCSSILLLNIIQYSMFNGAVSFNGDIDSWDVSNGIIFVSITTISTINIAFYESSYNICSS